MLLYGSNAYDLWRQLFLAATTCTIEGRSTLGGVPDAADIDLEILEAIRCSLSAIEVDFSVASY
jgi:hypothetical protein